MARYYPLIGILLASFNAISFVLVAILHLRDRRSKKTGWGGRPYRAAVVIFALVFLNLLGQHLADAILRRNLAVLAALDDLLSMLLLPVLAHAYYCGEERWLSGRRWWRAWLVLTYAVGVAAGVIGAASSAGLWRIGLTPRAADIPPTVCASAVALAALWMSRRAAQSEGERRRRRWVLILSAAWASLALAQEVVASPLLGIPMKAAPLVFLFIVTYYVERFAFFDVLLKKAAFGFTSLLLLTLFFAFGSTSIWKLKMQGWGGTLVWAVAVWPIVLLAPWGHRKLSRWLDRLWLGRRFSPAEANEYFFRGVQVTEDQTELVGLAEERLGTIFQAEAEVTLDAGTSAAGDDSIEAQLRGSGEPAGWMRVRAREDHPRFLSEDAALLKSLAEGFSVLLENQRLRGKRLEQEKRERELALHANRSELKALRAQVNPHFLFNALNAIAGLIPRDPERAERTIEQLAEVFRYTLRRSDREWVRVNDEMEAVRAYLDVEQARFRERLQVRIACSEEAGSCRIPAMAVQTLVENAIKHGVAAIRETGLVEIEALVEDSTLRIAVRDNGPGFREPRREAEDRGGFGLKNVRERLKGHFGGTARLLVERDTAEGMTVVTIETPRAA